MGGATNTIKRAGLAGVTGGISEFGQANPFGFNAVQNPIHPLAHQLAPGFFADPGDSNSGQYTSGPFSIDPAQIAADQASINNLGSANYNETNQFNSNDQAARAASRDKLAGLLTQQAQDSFKQTLPQTAEDYNAGHLLNSSGYGNEVARQQSNLASGIANQMGQVGINDINRSSDIGLNALQAKQGMSQSALSRGFSLNDFINQANVAKALGAQAAPQVGNGKGQTGALLSGVGATAPLIGALKGFGKGGPAGAAAGAGAGLLTSSAGSNLA